MNDSNLIWESIVTSPDKLNSIMWRVACGLSNAVGKTISNAPASIDSIPLSQVAHHAGGPEAEMVGIYLIIQSGIRGQALLSLPLHSAFNLCDLMLGHDLGSSSRLGEVERSVLAEVGNLTLSYFLNAVATHAGNSTFLRPSPPAVMVDMLGAILDVIITPVAVFRDDLLIIDTLLSDSRGIVQANLWILPDPAFRPVAA